MINHTQFIARVDAELDENDDTNRKALVLVTVWSLFGWAFYTHEELIPVDEVNHFTRG